MFLTSAVSAGSLALPEVERRGLWSRRSLREVQPVGMFGPLLRRERARAERSGRGFTIVMFRTATDEPRALLRLARVLLRRVRESDELMWVDARTLAALLPDTDRQGTARVAADVCDEAERWMPRPDCHAYASDEEVGRTGAGEIGGLKMKDGAVASAPSSLLHSPITPDRRRIIRVGGVDEHHLLPLQDLFLRPMPWWKRTMDVTGAAAGLVALMPLMLLVAAAIKATSAGPILFRQLRTGRGGRPFVLYKFRTMVVDADARKRELMARNEQDGPAFKMRRDPRVTRIGRLLRASSIDELPQLWNVLKGEMTLVGPRPLPCEESARCRRWHRWRLDVTPGLTCLWQVLGRSRVSFDQWMRMDVQYIRSITIVQDLKLLCQTIPAVLWRRTGR